MKKIFLSILGLCTITTPTLLSTSCVSISQQEKYIELVIDTKINTEYVELRKYTCDEWITFAKEFYDQNNNTQINTLFKIIQIHESSFIPNDTTEILEVKKNYKSDYPATLANLELLIKSNEIIFNINIKNLFIFSSSNFIPPKKFNYSFDQINLSTIADKSYKNINDAEWTNAFNATDKNSFVIPKNIYVITNKEIINNKIIITYKVDVAYIDQINLLPNKFEFKDITIEVTLSPFINKTPKYSFILNNIETQKAFGNNITIDIVNEMSELEIYNKLVKYVDMLEDIQPIKNCVDPNNPNKIFGFDKRKVIINNSINEKLLIKFKTSDTTQKTIEYKFELEFEKMS